MKTEKRWIRDVQENNHVCWSTGKDTRLLTRKRSCFNFLYKHQLHVYVSRWIKLCLILSRESIGLIPTIPQCTVHRRQVSFYPSGGITLIFFRQVCSLKESKQTCAVFLVLPVLGSFVWVPIFVAFYNRPLIAARLTLDWESKLFAGHSIMWFSLISLFNGISTFMCYLISKT